MAALAAETLAEASALSSVQCTVDAVRHNSSVCRALKSGRALLRKQKPENGAHSLKPEINVTFAGAPWSLGCA